MLQNNEIYLNGNNSTVQTAFAHETSKTFSYNGNDVLFDTRDDVMVNATQLAKIYGKRPNDYLSLPATNQLINAITRKYGISENQLVISKVGSSHNGGGTWMHRLIVVDFCQWLDIDLKLWCTEKLDELMRYGMTATQPTLEQMIDNPDLVIHLATQLKQEREERAKLEAQTEQQQATIKIQTEEIKKSAPKNRFSFGNLRNCCTFAVLTVRQTLLLRRAAVNCSMVIGHFLCSIFKDIRRLSIRSHCFVLRSKVCWTVSSVYGNRFSVAYNDLNAYSHGK